MHGRVDFGSGRRPDETGGWCRTRLFLMFEGLPRFPEVSFSLFPSLVESAFSSMIMEKIG